MFIPFGVGIAQKAGVFLLMNNSKLSQRKAFNFYRSFWDIAKEITDKEERLAFYEAIILKQFCNEDTELSGLAKFAYVSQKHSIDRQVEGYLNGLETPPPKGGLKGGLKKPLEKPLAEEKEEGEGEGEEQEKEKDKGQYDLLIAEVISYLNQVTGKKFSPKTATTKKLIGARLKVYSVEDAKKVIDVKSKQWLNDQVMNKYLRPETLFAESNFENYLNETVTPPPPQRPLVYN